MDYFYLFLVKGKAWRSCTCICGVPWKFWISFSLFFGQKISTSLVNKSISMLLWTTSISCYHLYLEICFKCIIYFSLYSEVLSFFNFFHSNFIGVLKFDNNRHPLKRKLLRGLNEGWIEVLHHIYLISLNFDGWIGV